MSTEQKPFGWFYKGHFHHFDPSGWASPDFPVVALYRELPQRSEESSAIQKPCAWGKISRYSGEIYDCITPEEHDREEGEYTVALYREPPQPKRNVATPREWVGLTDEKIEQGCKESWVTLQAWQSAVWWAEAKLKELNT